MTIIEKLSIIIVDDDPIITNKLDIYFKKQKYDSFVAKNIEDAYTILNNQNIDICILDILLKEQNGLELLREMRAQNSSIEFIIISGHGEMDIVIEAMRLGAIDFIKKPFSHYELDFAIERTKRFVEIQNLLKYKENHHALLSKEVENLIDMQMVGESSNVKKALEMAYLAGKDNNINVLITGENGTGKEIIARIIHYTSPRKSKPFYPINSTAVPETLLESEFFGHKRGAFTDAREDKKGLFELADGGTLFLDEIADMPITLQSKILRAIEDKSIRPLGSDKMTHVNTRIICATNCDIEKLIQENKFRKDLYHRINTFIIEMPPLRERTEDIEPLVKYFIQYFSKKKNKPIPDINPNVYSQLKRYSFPGNVREIKNMVERALLLCRNDKLEVDDFFGGKNMDYTKNYLYSDYNLEKNEKKLIESAFLKAEFNQKITASLLGISRDALLRRMKKYNISIQRHFL